jgi:outer membrane lipoprotein carrier protein
VRTSLVICQVRPLWTIAARAKMFFAAVGLGLAIMFGMPRLTSAATDTNGAAHSSTTNLSSLLKHLQRHYQQTDSFSAKFDETVTRVGAPPRDRTGMVYYQKPGRIRFDFAEPQAETIVSDGTMLYDYDPGLNQVVQAPLKQAFTTQRAAALLLGVGSVERDFVAAPVLNAPADGLDYVALTPKGGGDKIELGVEPKTSNIERLVLTDALGNVTVFKFSEIDLSPQLKSGLFVFTVPPGADIVSSQNPQ